MMILLWIPLVVVLFYMFDDRNKYSHSHNRETTAEEVLKLRYVKGEINEEAYEKMKKTIV